MSEEIEEITKGYSFIDPEFHFKINTYFIAVYSTITCIEDYFHSKSKELLKDISLFFVSVLEKNKSDPNTLPGVAYYN